MKIAIVGYGLEGKSAYNFFSKDKNNQITVLDSNPNLNLKNIKTKLGQDYLKNLDQFDLIVRSPGVRLSDIKTKKPVTSGTKIFFKSCPAKIIAVTGSKGKSTTTSLIYEILKSSGKKAWLGGNIGSPVLDFLEQIRPSDLVVLELSSFQLQDLYSSPKVAVILPIEPEHLDYHTDFEEYFSAKANIVLHQKSSDVVVYNINDANSKKLAGLSPAKKIAYGNNTKNKNGAKIKKNTIYMVSQRVCSAAKLKLPGSHNLENALAAITSTWQFTQDPKSVARALEKFKGLPHRLELVTEINGVKYYDDSIATTPSSAIAAIRAFDQPKVVILGGSDKGADFNDLAKTIATSNVIGAVVIGEMTKKIVISLKKVGFGTYLTGAKNMKGIITQAKKFTKPGSVVLLSPACASFDMFSNYQDRGDQFKEEVLDLESRQE